MRRIVSLAFVLHVLPACAGDDGGGTSETETTAGSTATSGDGSGTADSTGTEGGTTATTSGTTAGSTGGGSTTADSTSSGGGTTGGGDDVCARWNADRADLSEGTWTGDVGTCDPGDLEGGARERALTLVNLYRFLAGLPEVTLDPVRNQKTQACALMMDANGSLSHDPPPSWACYFADGAEAAGKSNISSGPAVSSVDLYMVDPGNATTLGHRRWILSNTLGPIGIGGTSGASCMWVLGGNGNAGAEFVAWPPAGVFPVQAVAPSWTSIDETGWSIQSDGIDLSGAVVSITRDGQPLAVDVTQLASGYGSTYAISMVPQGWTTTPGDYHVEVTGISTPIAYDVQVVDCGG